MQFAKFDDGFNFNSNSNILQTKDEWEIDFKEIEDCLIF